MNYNVHLGDMLLHHRTFHWLNELYSCNLELLIKAIFLSYTPTNLVCMTVTPLVLNSTLPEQYYVLPSLYTKHLFIFRSHSCECLISITQLKLPTLKPFLINFLPFSRFQRNLFIPPSTSMSFLYSNPDQHLNFYMPISICSPSCTKCDLGRSKIVMDKSYYNMYNCMLENL